MECVKKMVLVPIGKYSKLKEKTTSNQNVPSDLLTDITPSALDSTDKNMIDTSSNSSKQSTVDMLSDSPKQTNINDIIHTINGSSVNNVSQLIR